MIEAKWASYVQKDGSGVVRPWMNVQRALDIGGESYCVSLFSDRSVAILGRDVGEGPILMEERVFRTIPAEERGGLLEQIKEMLPRYDHFTFCKPPGTPLIA